MKRFSALILLASILLCAYSRQTENNGSQTTAVTDGVIYEYAADASDKKTAAVTYENGIEVSRDNYGYDESGNIVSVTTVQNGETVQTLGYTYEDGKLTESSREFTDDGIVCKEITGYDAEGYITSTTYYEDGEKTGRELFSYDENGNMIKSESVDADGNAITYTEYQYNEEDFIIRADYYEFENLALYFLYEYDDSGELTAVKKFDSNGNPLNQ